LKSKQARKQKMTEPWELRRIDGWEQRNRWGRRELLIVEHGSVGSDFSYLKEKEKKKTQKQNKKRFKRKTNN
jgi:hypothetical protein